jgi:CO/xanthine dehydrogenase Mo-binding subunit
MSAMPSRQSRPMTSTRRTRLWSFCKSTTTGWKPERNLANNLTAIHPVAGFGGPQPAGQPTIEFKIGDTANGFTEADRVVEGGYVIQLQCHVPIETHCCTALWEGGRLTVWDSQQSDHRACEVLAQVLHIPPENVRVSCKYLGGGFGGKCTDSPGKTLYQAIAALLAMKTGRPVRLEYTLKEEMFAEDTRNPFVFLFKTGVKNDGTITSLECKAIQRTGGCASSGSAVVAFAGEGIVNESRSDEDLGRAPGFIESCFWRPPSSIVRRNVEEQDEQRRSHTDSNADGDLRARR